MAVEIEYGQDQPQHKNYFGAEKTFFSSIDIATFLPHVYTCLKSRLEIFVFSSHLSHYAIRSSSVIQSKYHWLHYVFPISSLLSLISARSLDTPLAGLGVLYIVVTSNYGRYN